MSNEWYCLDCEEHIEAAEIEAHESQDHTVKGRIEPERLLSQTPREEVDVADEPELDPTDADESEDE